MKLPNSEAVVISVRNFVRGFTGTGLGIALLLSAVFSHADESRPGSLVLTESLPSQFDVEWKRPIRGSKTVELSPLLPDHCELVGNRISQVSSGASAEKWRVNCGQTGLQGHAVEIEGLDRTFTDVLVRITMLDGLVHNQLVNGKQPGFIVAQTPTSGEVAVDYVILGIEHILIGIDHLLFVMCLVLLVSGIGNLVKTITAFTVAHSITLAGSVLGFVSVPQRAVEAIIALSILFLARELLVYDRNNPSLSARSPWLVAAAFGLLHGFGFAGALSEIGLPQNDIPLALLMFNVGVEIGQLIFVAIILTTGWAIRKIPLPKFAYTAMVYTIGSVAGLWMIERLSGYWI